MISLRCISSVVFLMFLGTIALSGNAFGYASPPASYSWNSSQPGYEATATLHDGTIDTSTLTMGDFEGRSAALPYASSYGSSGGMGEGWDDTWTGGGNANTNGDALDGLWVQIYSDGGWWDLGAAYDQVAVFTSQDHGPYLGEGLEYRVRATNTLWTGSLVQGTLSDVYLDGWRTHIASEDLNKNGWLSDDISGVFDLGGSYRYIQLTAWATSGSYSEPEIDAVAGVAPVPEPSTILLVGTGLLGIIGFGRKRLNKKA